MESQGFNFENLFVLDIANNHQGDVDHGKRIIRDHAKVVHEFGVRAAFKFQFRDLDTFIHPDFLDSVENKHIPRFLGTRLEPNHFVELLGEVRNQNLLSMCTPFDERSVDRIVEMEFDIIKVASASARDWPLLERVAQSNLPVLFSTGGLSHEDIGKLVSFFEHRGCDFAMMHCVSIYPTPAEKSQLNQIEVLLERHRGRVVGWSTHESPEELLPVAVAYAKGARIFERHVGIVTQDWPLNAYSSTPEQIADWLRSWTEAKTLCGGSTKLEFPEETKALAELQRGVYLSRDIEEGEELNSEAVFFAVPFQENQLSSGEWRPGIVAKKDLKAGEPLFSSMAKLPPRSENEVLKKAIHEIKAMLSQAGVFLPQEFDVDFSHHYGKARFREYGAVIINSINRKYCKKVIVVLPGQQHPAHFHKLKEESFQVLSGDLHVELDGRVYKLMPGDVLTVLPGVFHSFSSEGGCVFEEVSTTHLANDSVYRDPRIQQQELSERKTSVNHWGRFQMAD